MSRVGLFCFHNLIQAGAMQHIQGRVSQFSSRLQAAERGARCPRYDGSPRPTCRRQCRIVTLEIYASE